MHEATSNLVVLTGGGTAGHVMPNLALAPVLCDAGYSLVYVGSRGMEEELAEKAGIPFFRVQSGKLRRYLSLENFIDVFRLLFGIVQAFVLMVRLRPACVFSKGGFVAVPVAVGAWLAGVPVISHESDVSPGLANRIIARFARMNLHAFPETARYLSGRPSRCVGIPVRPALFEGDKETGLALCGWGVAGATPDKDPDGSLPVVLIMGGSQGAVFLNDLVMRSLPELLRFCRIVHLTGRGKMSGSGLDSIPSEQRSRYRAFEFVNSELPDILALTDLAVCRSGANSIFELLALGKSMILVPLEKGSRGDQILNAESFRKQGWAQVLREDDLDPKILVSTIRKSIASAIDHQAPASRAFERQSAADAIVSEVDAIVKGQR